MLVPATDLPLSLAVVDPLQLTVTLVPRMLSLQSVVLVEKKVSLPEMFLPSAEIAPVKSLLGQVTLMPALLANEESLELAEMVAPRGVGVA